MNNENRIDQILIGLGYVTEEQIKNAVRKQRLLGGRIGTQLLKNGDVTEEELAEALSIQLQVPAFKPAQQRISPACLKKAPAALILKHEMLPAEYDAGSGLLTLVAVDPRNVRGVAEMRRAMGGTELRILVTPEAVFAKLLAQYGIHENTGAEEDSGVRLPDLFEDRGRTETQEAMAAPTAAKEERRAPGVLLVTKQLFLKNYLGPVFEREGWQLRAAVDLGEIRQLLAEGGAEKILVSEGMVSELRKWLRRGELPAVKGELVEFASVSGALLENPAPYSRLYQSLTQALKLVAETHAAHAVWVPPYDLLRNEVGELARILELGRFPCEALQLAVLLVAPARLAPGDPPLRPLEEPEPHGIDWQRTLEQARVLRYPWPLEAALRSFRELLSERVNLDEFHTGDPELALAGQILAVVWYRHYGLSRQSDRSMDRLGAVKTGLRKKSLRLARPEVIEAYLLLLERQSEDLSATAYHQLLLVGPEKPARTQLATRLRHLGYHPLPVRDVEEAKKLCEREPPAAVFIDVDAVPDPVPSGGSSFKEKNPVYLYAFTAEPEPSRMLDLLDAGFDDVFSLPRDSELIAARLRKSLKEIPKPPPAGGFRASFAAFAFTDLLQGLSQGFKSVRIVLNRSKGEKAEIFLENGRLHYAHCQESKGPEAIYQIIAWGDDGEFTVEPATEFPEPNIAMSLESVLMEGCRLLDESRA
ncbi:MAG: DUF4388 domain-containing protein [Deltaproteobacteria bacterium]|nr:DUF4388 domain-containing protein [Deltaproteobacteria bacterium]